MRVRLSCLVSVSTLEDGNTCIYLVNHGEHLKWVRCAFRERSSSRRERKLFETDLLSLRKSRNRLIVYVGDYWLIGSKRDCWVRNNIVRTLS